MKNTQLSDEQELAIEKKWSEKSVVKQNVSMDSNQTEVKENFLSEKVKIEITKCDSNEAIIIEDSGNFSKPQLNGSTVILELN